VRLYAKDLIPTPHLDVARDLLSVWEPPTLDQEHTRDRMLAFLSEHPADAHLRTCLPGHLTASALVVDARRERALLTFHTKLRRWLQLGGHCDGDANLSRVALREAIEESGIEGLAIEPMPIDLDIHAIPARKGEPEHLHLDTRFLVWAPEGAEAKASGESVELRWFEPGEIEDLRTDDSVRRLFRLVFAR